MEDDDDYATFVRRLVHRTGYGLVPDVVHDERSAVQALDRQQYDIVVSDFELSPGNGVRVLEHVRKTWPKARRILLTSAPDKARRSLPEDDGVADAVWDKRWDTMTIQDHLRTLLKPDR